MSKTIDIYPFFAIDPLRNYLRRHIGCVVSIPGRVHVSLIVPSLQNKLLCESSGFLPSTSYSATYLNMLCFQCLPGNFARRVEVGIHGFWRSYRNIERLITEELMLDPNRVFTPYVRSALYTKVKTKKKSYLCL